MDFLSNNEEKTKELAQKIAQKLKVGDVLFLTGYLGSGKTTFTRFLAKELGFKDRTQSPTFVIHRKYDESTKEIKIINHLDLYRLKTTQDIIELGLEEIVSEKNSITIIEWPELCKEMIKNAIELTFEYKEEGRKINIKGLNV